VEVLITNMMGCEAYEVDLFKELYYLRWGIEENYKRLKQWVEIENFSGKSVVSIRSILCKMSLCASRIKVTSRCFLFDKASSEFTWSFNSKS
jgi:hypothetical protein